MPAPRHHRHKAGRAWRLRRLLWAVPVAAVLAGGGLYLSATIGSGSTSATGASDTALTSGNCSPAAAPGGQPAGGATPCASSPAAGAPTPSPSPSASRRRAGAPHHRATRPPSHHGGPPSRPPATPPATHPPAPPPSSKPPASGEYGPAEAQVLALINQARAQAGLAPYTITSGLVSSASAHTQVMASGCGLSHQCPGEPPLGTRESDAGVHWTAAGENIGEAGPIARNASAIAQAAVGLTQDMLNEKPPDDGHRLNILSSAFHHAGIVVSLDSSGTLWMTQDFSN